MTELPTATAGYHGRKILKYVMVFGASRVDPVSVAHLNPTRGSQLPVHLSSKIEITQVFYYLSNKSLKLKSRKVPMRV